ncbi:hypothetical protein [Corynebacterium freiburgense]|uniref:hypothetical protein n=1 Tax=Corynebacterium freiburgense TaxID=556548 RepID=UPI000427C4AE|nr:hypothetical protein [Corynebacterium freiburgense]WJZ03344.1 hypothetical protein CFREI_10350 [Corynebacterium freiburgense]
MEKVGLEISVFEDFTSVFIQPQVYRPLIDLGVDVGVPLLVPSSLEVFADIDAYVAVSYGAVGNDPTQIPALDTAQKVYGISPEGTRFEGRHLVTAEIVDFEPISGTKDFVLGAVMLDIWGEAYMVLPQDVVEHLQERPIVWCACDYVESMSDYAPAPHYDPNNPYAVFRLGLHLASQYAPVTIWQLMTELGESWSMMVSLLAALESEGYLLCRTHGAAELYFLEQLFSSHTPVSPSAEADAACEALLTSIDALLADVAKRNDPVVGSAANLLARQVLSKAPTRLLARFIGREELELPAPPPESWIEEPQYPGQPVGVHYSDINVYDQNVWLRLHRARALIKVSLLSDVGDANPTSVFTVGSIVGDYIELENVITSQLILVHPSDLRDISVLGSGI